MCAYLMSNVCLEWGDCGKKGLRGQEGRDDVEHARAGNCGQTVLEDPPYPVV